jgi:hypothetical protein
MKKYLDRFAIIYIVLTTMFFNKIIETNIGLITYSTTTIILMLVVVYNKYIKKRANTN